MGEAAGAMRPRAEREERPAPEGFRYAPELVPREEEADLVERIRELPLKEFEFHGYLGKRRVVYFGWQYSYGDRTLNAAPEIPGFLAPLRQRAAAFAGLAAEDLVHAMATEYRPGTAIGWHRDKAAFGEVIGVSLHSACLFRLRRKTGVGKWERYSVLAEPRSAYLLRGAARSEWQHSIPAVAGLRYSVTFRSLAGGAAPAGRGRGKA